jgi:hypothetical protein
MLEQTSTELERRPHHLLGTSQACSSIKPLLITRNISPVCHCLPEGHNYRVSAIC